MDNTKAKIRGQWEKAETYDGLNVPMAVNSSAPLLSNFIFYSRGGTV